MPFDAYYAFRRNLTETVERDLIGPAAVDEVIEDPPITRYIAGILYPRAGDSDEGATIDADQDIDVPDDDEVETMVDPPVALASVRYPSSMGITFAVDAGRAPRVLISVQAARYTPLDATSEPTGDGLMAGRRVRDKQRWRRLPIITEPVVVDVTRPNPGWKQDVAPGLQLFCRIRRSDAKGSVAVTTALVNTLVARNGPGQRDADAFFQPEIRVTTPDAPGGGFVERPTTVNVGNDADLRAYRLLYRHAREFATGHGCSVQWEVSPSAPDRTAEIRSTFAPQFAVRLSDSNPHIQGLALGMRYLRDAPQGAVLDGLTDLARGYDDWIAQRTQEVESLPEALQGTATEHLQLCTEALTRIRNGIEVLRTIPQAWEAFRLTNEAMLQQRARTLWLQQDHHVGAPIEEDGIAWRPFQLAFILQCLGGIADPFSSERNLADLLWFPTGGGKTEAYLGLIAFTVFLRRMRHADGGGVTALMRYTLRLLTIQQFERATLLICCCEAIRRVRTDLGSEPISIGLWVGEGATPNKLSDARAALNKLRIGGYLEGGNPCQLRACAWCGTPLDAGNYGIAADKPHMIVACGQAHCLYKTGLPVYLVDEDVYNYRPTLIIATVDKFAALPWREEAAELFNLATTRNVQQPAPELIIQDELHLISGPLGTLVGLYETAIDALCTRNGVRPKVIASTATIRRARGQTKALFDREIRQFPPAGLDARDSYFATEAGPDARGTRLYIGLMSPGTSHTSLLVRAYAALLQGVEDLAGTPSVKDPYWTLVGYFNSLRVLGGALMQVQDDVTDRMGLIAKQGGTEKRSVDERIELTSREPSGAIPEHLKRMARRLDATEAGPPTLDVILATNMISVGVDIDRLGLMAVMGQPQSTSEYIQSTSRVGRKWPGLVVVLFNAARSRDRSHYESFVAYHSALYRQVESTSVTPFSARARDRALHAVLVTLARMERSQFRPEGQAGQIKLRRVDLDSIVTQIVARVASVAPDEVEAVGVQLQELLDLWEEHAMAVTTLPYSSFSQPTTGLMVNAALEGPQWDSHFRTLWSLRDVEQESKLYLIQLEDRS